jgi:hypothetical protein
MARESDVYGFTGGLITVKAGGGSALLINAAPGQVSVTMKYASGGSLEIHPCPVGASAASTLPTGSSGYLLATSEVFNTSGPTRMFLVATGSDANVFFLKGLGPGF